MGLERLVQDLVPGDSKHRGFCSGGAGLREGEGLQPGTDMGMGSNGASRAQVCLARYGHARRALSSSTWLNLSFRRRLREKPPPPSPTALLPSRSC